MFEIDCRRVLEHLEAYLDGEAAAEVCGQIERHVAECEICLDHREFRLRLAGVVRRACGEAELPAGLDQRIRRALTASD